MSYYALLYYVIDDYLSRRALFREAHLRRARDAHRRGDLLLAGALGDPPDRALLVFRTQDPSVVEEFARIDPVGDPLGDVVGHVEAQAHPVDPGAFVVGEPLGG